MKPTLSEPRSLAQTQYSYSQNSDGTMTYDSPEEMAQYLYADQGSAYKNFQGTCGLCSCANVLRLSGVNLGEKDIIDYATKADLCTKTLFNFPANGGTSPAERQKILEHFGIPSSAYPIHMDNGTATIESINEIANHVADGRGVIISVHANTLYNKGPAKNDFHAVTVTSVKKNRYGDVAGFYICDSNRGTAYYPAFVVQEALTGNDMNVTNTHIR